MANEYKVNADDLTAVADAIRVKAGFSGSIAFPAGFVSAIGNINTGAKPKLIKMTIDHHVPTVDDTAWGTKTYSDIFLSGNIFATGNAIADTTNTDWKQYSTFAKPTPTTEHYNTSPSSWNCSGTKSVQMYKDLSLPNGNTFYIACKRRLASYTAGNWLGVEVYYIGGDGKVISDAVNASSVSETFQTVSHTFTPKTATTQIWVGCGGSANLTGYVDDVVCINMTQLFGSNMPTKAEMDNLYEKFLSLYNRAMSGETTDDAFYAYGTFSDEDGHIVACSASIPDGSTLYVPFDGQGAVVVFEYHPNGGDFEWATINAETVWLGDTTGYDAANAGSILVYYMAPAEGLESDVYEIAVTLSGDHGDAA